MVKQLATLPADIHNLLDGASLEDSIGRFTDDIGKMMIKRFKDHDREPSLRMSNIGRPLRQLWYELRGQPGEKLSGQTKFKFLYGDLLESLGLYLSEAAGHKVERLQEEIEVDGIKGHIDAVIDGVLIDIKSCSSYSFNKFKYGTLFDDDAFGYVAQLSGYAHALGLPAAWIAIDKVSGEICILELPKDKIDKYDVRKRIQTCRSTVDLGVEPERCYEDVADGKSGNRKLGVGCSYCSYKWHCWRDSNGGKGLQVYTYSTGPKYLTVVSKEPRVERQDWYEFPPAEQKPASKESN